MSRSQHVHTAWAWFKAELLEQLGPDRYEYVFAEYAKRARLDKQHNDRVDAPENLARLESYARTRAYDSAELRRLEKRIARLRALIDKEP